MQPLGRFCTGFDSSETIEYPATAELKTMCYSVGVTEQ